MACGPMASNTWLRRATNSSAGKSVWNGATPWPHSGPADASRIATKATGVRIEFTSAAVYSRPRDGEAEARAVHTPELGFRTVR